MCEKCFAAVKKHYPDLTGDQIGELLMGATCFPFGTTEKVEADLIKVKAHTDGTLGAALRFADEELYREMKKWNEPR